MELKSTFNEVAAEYDKWRPAYVPELYDDIITFSGIGKSSHLLEIGIGTGQAATPFLEMGCHVSAVEPGDSLAAYTQEKFSCYKDFIIRNIAFEEFVWSDISFDMIYSATAFHWIPEEIGYTKVFKLLKSGGTFARFRNHAGPDIDNKSLEKSMQKVYSKYMPDNLWGHSYNSISEYAEHVKKTCKNIVDISKRYGFIDVDCKLYYRTRIFEAEDYMQLLGTYSDHIALGEEKIAFFQKEMTDVINDFGGKITINDIIDLQLSRKP